MRLQTPISIPTIIFLLVFAASAFAQSNATYDLSHNVIAGGGDKSTNANFRFEGTVGQPAAGIVSGNALASLHGGFWNASPLAPTAARVSITGSVSNLDGGIVRRVRIVLSDSTTGEIRTAQTNSFGRFSFTGLEVGRVYILQAQSKNFQFTPDSYIFTLLDARDDLDFTAVESR
jgi:hypothetical protein